MNRFLTRAGALVITSALCLSSAGRLGAQATTPTTNSTDDSASTPVVLSAFEVSTENDVGYAARDTLAGTRLRTQLKDVGSSIQVITGKFLQDTNTRSVEDLLVYTTGTEVAGQGGNFLGQGDGAVLTGTNRSSANSITRVRGLAEADNTRDFFVSDIPFDSYNVGRLDLQRGPNSVLFGIGKPAGIVNSSLNTAGYKDANKLEFQFGTFGSARASADFNKVLIKDELAIRVSLLDNAIKYRQNPAFKNDKRAFGALRWDPKFLVTPSMRTTFRANFEKGEIRSNNPRGTPPLDAITPWYNLGKPTFDQRTATDVIGALPTNNFYGAPGGRVFDGVITTFNGGSQGISYPAAYTTYPNYSGNTNNSGIGNNTLRGIRTYNEYANAAFPAGAIGAYKAKSLTDSSIFDFRNNLLEGPNKREFNDFNALNLALVQTFFNGKAGIELVYDRQQTKNGYANFLSGDASVITVDIMNTLSDGSANPNVGRPFTISGGGSAGLFWRDQTRDSKRATAYGEFNFADQLGKESTVAQILGRHVFTGLLAQQKTDKQERNGPRFFLGEDYIAVKRDSGGVINSLGQASRDDIFYNYLGGSVAGLTNASGIHLTGVKSTVTPQGSSTINSYNNVTNTFQQVPLIVQNNDLQSDDAKSYTNGVKNREVVDTGAFIWQAYLFDGNLVPMFGLRRDKDLFRSAGSPGSIRGVAQVQDPTWRLPDSELDTNKGQRKWATISRSSKTWSIVGHVPKSIMKSLPGQLGLSAYYNKSENFEPDASRRDIFGNPAEAPSGETKDYGITITALDEKVSLRINRYRTKVSNANVAGEIGGQYLIGAVEGWGQSAAVKFRDGPGNQTVFGFSGGKAVTWKPPGATKGSQATGFTYSQAELDATWAREDASIKGWFNTQVPANFQQMWGLTDYATGGGSINFGPAGLSVTGDTISEGTEFELVATPIKGLDVSINASKTSAKRVNLAKSYTDWILKRQSQFVGAAGDMRLWGNEDDFASDSTHGGETARGKYSRETIAGYNLFQALQDSNVPELRPWRFNAVANYTFQSASPLKGVNVGGSYRWQQSNTTGFPVIRNAAGALTFDVAHPYKGSTEGVTDVWVGYEHKLNAKVKWRVQLNVRDLFATDSLSRVTVQPDGSPGSYRIAEPRVISLTNTFSF